MAKTISLLPFYNALMQFLALSKQQLCKIAAEYDLTAPQALMLLLTTDDQTHTMHSFCTVLGCDASNVTGIVDGLQRKGLMKRAEHPTDRRIKTLHLEPTGAAIRDAIMGRMSDSNQSYILSTLSPGEVAEFTRLLQKITSGYNEQMALRPPGK